jgi:hypothetical protein
MFVMKYLFYLKKQFYLLKFFFTVIFFTFLLPFLAITFIMLWDLSDCITFFLHARLPYWIYPPNLLSFLVTHRFTLKINLNFNQFLFIILQVCLLIYFHFFGFLLVFIMIHFSALWLCLNLCCPMGLYVIIHFISNLLEYFFEIMCYFIKEIVKNYFIIFLAVEIDPKHACGLYPWNQVHWHLY